VKAASNGGKQEHARKSAQKTTATHTAEAPKAEPAKAADATKK
jgi:hypothetical protein